MASKFYDIDSNKLHDLLLGTGKTKSEISLSMGFERTFINTVLSRKKISYPAANLLNSIYGISIDEYINTLDSEPEQVQEETHEINLDLVIDWDKLEECIFRAVVRAFKEG